MNKNEKSLIEHALKLRGLQYNDDIEVTYYKTMNIVSSSSNKYAMFGLGIGYLFRVDSSAIYVMRNSNLNINVRSFINHWALYYNINNISHVAVHKCLNDSHHIAVSCNNKQYYVIASNNPATDEWLAYKW